MKTRSLIRTIITSAILIILVVFAAGAYAETFEISENASDSNNSIQFNQNNSTNLNQSNSADVNNSVNINSNTGGNSLNGNVGDGSITTGDINNNVNINNQLNNNSANVGCNNCPTPTKKPSVSPTPTPPGGITPTTPPGVGGNGGNGGGGGNGNGGGGSSDPGVLGLAATSGENSLFALFKLLPAFVSMTIGYSLLRKNG